MHPDPTIPFIIASFLFVGLFLLGTLPILRHGLKKTVCEQFENTNDRNREWILSHLPGAARELFIVSGALNPLVYSQEFVDALHNKLQATQGLAVRILTGPEILTLNGEGNPLYRFLQSKPFPERLKIRFLPERPQNHFRIVDSTHLFLEDPHNQQTQNRLVTTWENTFFKGWVYKQEFERLWLNEGRIREVVLTPITRDAS